MKQRRLSTKGSIAFRLLKPLKYLMMTTHRVSTTRIIRMMSIDICFLVLLQKETFLLYRTLKD